MEPRTTAIEPRKPSAAAMRAAKATYPFPDSTTKNVQTFARAIDKLTGIPEAIEALEIITTMVADETPIDVATMIKCCSALARLRGETT